MKTIQFKVPDEIYNALLALNPKKPNLAAREIVLATLEFDGEIPAPGGNRYERFRVGDSIQVDADAWRLADTDWIDETKAVSGQVCQVVEVTRYDLLVEWAGVRAPVNFSQAKKVDSEG